jgi:hypothetical protein
MGSERNVWLDFQQGDRLTFGTSEGSFNKKVCEALSEGPSGDAIKIVGTAFKRGQCDIMGHLEGIPLFLENKFVASLPTRDDTVVIGPKTKPGFSEDQALFMAERIQRISRPSADIVRLYIGGLIAFFLPHEGRAIGVVLGVSSSFITERRSLTAGEVREYFRVEPTSNPFRLYGNLNSNDRSLIDLVNRLEEVR